MPRRDAQLKSVPLAGSEAAGGLRQPLLDAVAYQHEAPRGGLIRTARRPAQRQEVRLILHPGAQSHRLRADGPDIQRDAVAVPEPVTRGGDRLILRPHMKREGVRAQLRLGSRCADHRVLKAAPRGLPVAHRVGLTGEIIGHEGGIHRLDHRLARHMAAGAHDAGVAARRTVPRFVKRHCARDDHSHAAVTTLDRQLGGAHGLDSRGTADTLLRAARNAVQRGDAVGDAHPRHLPAIPDVEGNAQLARAIDHDGAEDAVLTLSLFVDKAHRQIGGGLDRDRDHDRQCDAAKQADVICAAAHEGDHHRVMLAGIIKRTRGPLSRFQMIAGRDAAPHAPFG